MTKIPAERELIHFLDTDIERILYSDWTGRIRMRQTKKGSGMPTRRGRICNAIHFREIDLFRDSLQEGMDLKLVDATECGASRICYARIDKKYENMVLMSYSTAPNMLTGKRQRLRLSMSYIQLLFKMDRGAA